MEYDENNNIWASQYMKRNADLDDERLTIDRYVLYDILSEFTDSFLIVVAEGLQMDIEGLISQFSHEAIKQQEYKNNSHMLILTDDEFVSLLHDFADLIVEEIANEPVESFPQLQQTADNYKEKVKTGNIKVYHGMEAYEGKDPNSPVPFGQGRSVTSLRYKTVVLELLLTILRTQVSKTVCQTEYCNGEGLLKDLQELLAQEEVE